MTLREYVQSLAQRLNQIEGTSGVSKDYVDTADDIIRGSVTALRRHVDVEDEAIRGSVLTLGDFIDGIIDGTQPVASAMEAYSALKATNTASGKDIDEEIASINELIQSINGVDESFAYSKAGNVVTLYAQLSGLSSDNRIVLGTIHEKPKIGYAIIPFYSSSVPFVPIGSVWIDASGTATLYKPSEVASGYIGGTYVSY